MCSIFKLANRRFKILVIEDSRYRRYGWEKYELTHVLAELSSFSSTLWTVANGGVAINCKNGPIEVASDSVV